MTRNIQLRKSLVIAASEGARTSVIPGATNDDVVAAGNGVLQDRRVINGDIVVTPGSVSDANVGDIIQVSASASAEDNATLPAMFFQNRIISVSVHVMKEY
ncbi:MAG: hypothetical protein ACI9G1_003872 [Pirellulaceae bacterium]